MLPSVVWLFSPGEERRPRRRNEREGTPDPAGDEVRDDVMSSTSDENSDEEEDVFYDALDGTETEDDDDDGLEERPGPSTVPTAPLPGIAPESQLFLSEKHEARLRNAVEMLGHFGIEEKLLKQLLKVATLQFAQFHLNRWNETYTEESQDPSTLLTFEVDDDFEKYFLIDNGWMFAMLRQLGENGEKKDGSSTDDSEDEGNRKAMPTVDIGEMDHDASKIKLDDDFHSDILKGLSFDEGENMLILHAAKQLQWYIQSSIDDLLCEIKEFASLEDIPVLVEALLQLPLDEHEWCVEYLIRKVHIWIIGSYRTDVTRKLVFCVALYDYQAVDKHSPARKVITELVDQIESFFTGRTIWDTLREWYDANDDSFCTEEQMVFDKTSYLTFILRKCVEIVGIVRGLLLANIIPPRRILDTVLRLAQDLWKTPYNVINFLACCFYLLDVLEEKLRVTFDRYPKVNMVEAAFFEIHCQILMFVDSEYAKFAPLLVLYGLMDIVVWGITTRSVTYDRLKTKHEAKKSGKASPNPPSGHGHKSSSSSSSSHRSKRKKGKHRITPLKYDPITQGLLGSSMLFGSFHVWSVHAYKTARHSLLNQYSDEEKVEENLANVDDQLQLEREKLYEVVFGYKFPDLDFFMPENKRKSVSHEDIYYDAEDFESDDSDQGGLSDEEENPETNEQDCDLIEGFTSF